MVDSSNEITINVPDIMNIGFHLQGKIWSKVQMRTMFDPLYTQGNQMDVTDSVWYRYIDNQNIPVTAAPRFDHHIEL